MAFDAANDAFAGLLENTTSGDLLGVRIAVQLPDGSELSTEPVDLATGDVLELALPVDGAIFDSYSVSVQLGDAETMG